MPIMETLSDQLRRCITEAARASSLRQVARDAKIDVAILSRLLSGIGGLSVDGIDRLGKVIKLELRRSPPTRPRRVR
jgi:hypothetical protein